MSGVGAGPELVRALQERAARGLPAQRVVAADGWWLRHAPRCSWWVGTVLPHAEAAGRELERRVAVAERFYAGRGTVTRFQITPGACPADLDSLLADRGYCAESPMWLRTAPTARVRAQRAAGLPRAVVDDRPSREWFDAWYAVHGGDAGAEWDLLERVALPSGYARAMLAEEIVAVGRAVADTGWVGVFGMATLPEARGRGAARAVLAGIAGWAARHRAEHLYLQVERDNVPALRLYERAGFTETRGYHYRTAA